MTFKEWLEEIEVFTSREGRFMDDLDHHVEGSKGSYERMFKWLEAAYLMGVQHAELKLMDDGK